MSIMTAEQYDERKSALTSAISHAEGEFQSASFKELMSNGSTSASAKAKQHLDLTREELVKIEAAWVASQQEVARLEAKSIADDFDASAAQVDALFADRKKALRGVMRAADAFVSELSRYQDATAAIRKKAFSISGNAAWIQGTLENNVAATAFSAILRTAHISLNTGSFLRDAFPNGDACAFEDRLAHNVRAAIRQAAPQPEAA